ncbi:hypothetical protein IMSAGC003_02501 [Lachnospiraceae bacterium]|nr:DUF6115 domain-containing protein [Acetatifactor sp.]GFH95950.1 hypothetical protein IMSAGC003_02501 [Lachnospiraceae bacterium]
MNIMEIVLLVIGILVFVASFLIPNGKGDNLAHDREMARDEIGDLVARELERIRSQVDDTVEEAIKDSMDKTERSLEKLSNEKIMAVSEYSETVLGQINKSQQEILFLYDMLNAKHDNLKNTASEVEQRVKEAEIASREVEAVTREAEMALRETEAAAQMARQMVAPAFQAMQDGEETASAEQETGEEIVEEPQQELQGTESYSNKNHQILELHRQGHSEVAIARQLDLGVGEVKLVIDLFEGRND